MAVAGQRQDRLSFGTFELDRESGELSKRGLPLRVQEKPLQLLLVLLEHPGEVVSREDLQRRLWPNGTYVDFEKGLNTAVKKLRYALGDSPDKPVFIETIPRRGYRFIAPVSANGFLHEEPPADEPIFPSATDALTEAGLSLGQGISYCFLTANGFGAWVWRGGCVGLGFVLSHPWRR